MSFSENDKTFELQNKVELPDCYAENYPNENGQYSYRIGKTCL